MQLIHHGGTLMHAAPAPPPLFKPFFLEKKKTFQRKSTGFNDTPNLILKCPSFMVKAHLCDWMARVLIYLRAPS